VVVDLDIKRNMHLDLAIHQLIVFLLKIILKGLKIGLIKMKTIEVTIQELQAATRPNVYRNRKKYTRKDKHRNKSIEN
jgi:hypothetical protein